MCCRTSPAIPRPWRGWRAAISTGGDIERARTTLAAGQARAASRTKPSAPWKPNSSCARRRRPKPGETAALRAKLAADPKDHQARYDLALALDAAGDRDGAVAELLELVRRDRKWNEEAARKQLVTLFEAMGPTDPRTIDARRRLSGLLFS